MFSRRVTWPSLPNGCRPCLALHEAERRWIYTSGLSGVLMLIGLVTLFFMLRVSGYDGQGYDDRRLLIA